MMRSLATPMFAALLLGACTNFHVVEKDRFYRSGQPTAAQLDRWIEEYDLETVVCLCTGGPGKATYEASYRPTVEHGIEFVQVSISALRLPSRDDLVALCDVFENGKYPMLVHCRAGADRSGLASAIYMLHRTGDLEQARDQLVFLPYGHLGWGGTASMDEVLDRYERHGHGMSFAEWARRFYSRPGVPAMPPERPSSAKADGL